MQSRFYYLAFLSLFLPLCGISQSETGSSYAFLNLPYSARSIALGGDFVSIYDGDLSLALANPSLINGQMNQNIQLNFVDYFSDINYGSASYGFQYKNLGNFAASIQFIDYGEFSYANETGERYGTFGAGDYAATLGWSRALDTTFYIGANLKALYSNYESYNSFGLAVDVAATYWLAEKKFSASILFRNIGSQLKAYTPDTREPLPFEIQAALSKELAHLPLRISVIFTNLQKWDLTYSSLITEPTNLFDDTETSTTPSGINSFADKLMRHIVFGAELKPIKYLSVRVGYNYLKRKEMTIPTKLSTVGFSWGFGVNIYKFNINYARNAQHLTASPNYLSISTNLSSFSGK
ncbi:MAG: type IX secretion system protein PorQ [Bacteroidales bacterium]|nr:type IX secretion system protein PorQ [Bacteroidales bacterium]